MAALADQHAPAATGRVGVIHRVRTAVGLLAVDPENLPAGLFQDFPFLLDGRSVNPVLGVQQPSFAPSFRRQHPPHTVHRPLQGQLLVRAVPMEILRAVAEVARQRLLANDELITIESGDGDRLVGHRRHTDVNGVDLVEQGVETVEERGCRVSGRKPSAVLVARMHADNFHIRAIDLAAAHGSETTRKSRSRRFPCEQLVWSWIAAFYQYAVAVSAKHQREFTSSQDILDRICFSNSISRRSVLVASTGDSLPRNSFSTQRSLR